MCVSTDSQYNEWIRYGDQLTIAGRTTSFPISRFFFVVLKQNNQFRNSNIAKLNVHYLVKDEGLLQSYVYDTREEISHCTDTREMATTKQLD
jgi:hypothetical protein